MVSYGDFWSIPTENAVKKLIAENRLPKAFICANDTMAITVCGVLADNNIKVPEDIIVTGFDGIEAIKFSVPKITSCLCSYEDMARETAEVLDKAFDGDNSPVRRMIVPRLVISESCGCRCAEPINTSLYLNNVNNRSFTSRRKAMPSTTFPPVFRCARLLKRWLRSSTALSIFTICSVY